MALKWKSIRSNAELDAAKEQSLQEPILIFKHSTSCPISSIAKLRLEDGWDLDQLPTYYVDVIADRPVAREIADVFDVQHESPQAIIISKGEAVYDISHLDIKISEIKDGLKEVEV